MHRKWLREELEAEGYSHPYISEVAYASRFSGLKAEVTGARAPERIKRAEYTGRIAAYTDSAIWYLHDSHGLTEEQARVLVKEHMKKWQDATEEDRAFMKEEEQ